MNRNRQSSDNSKKYNKKRPNTKGQRRDKRESREEKYDGDNAKLELSGRNNDPNWYFLDKSLAEVTSQMSFQNLAGYDVDIDSVKLPVTNIMGLYLNPCPGVQLQGTYSGYGAQKSAINLAGFRLFSKLSAYTGRVANYGPQDISTMILAMGEIISQIEWIRRCFGICFLMNMRNRDYPRNLLIDMGVDADDLFAHYSDYRTQFNTIITRINQIPIPKNIAYFDKCASLYERYYLDAPSAMAQTIFFNPATTWILDESSWSGGSILKTIDWAMDASQISVVTNQPLSAYLATTSQCIDALMNSSTLQVVYTDLLNLATKMKTDFWTFDYLLEGYNVMPEYNMNFLLQMHNMSNLIIPNKVTTTAFLVSDGVTPNNDVYPNANDNALYYNPAFLTYNAVANGPCRCNYTNIIDMPTDQPTVEDRIEVTRFTCAGGKTYFDDKKASINYVLPDHYCVRMEFYRTDGTHDGINGSNVPPAALSGIALKINEIDWHPFFFEANASTGALTGGRIGDLNFYTTISDSYLRKLHDFVGLALYDLR